jgi:GTPase SAR1 family protein
MGACSSSNHADGGVQTPEVDTGAASTNPGIIRVASSENGQLKEFQTKPLLLLGAGDSGKSTIFKQVKVLYNHEPPLSKGNALELLHQNVLEVMQLAIKHTPQIDDPQFSKKADIIKSLDTATDRLDKFLAQTFQELMSSCPQLKTTIEGVPNQKRGYFWPDNADYLIGKLDQFVLDGYELTNEDLLRLRQRTTGIVNDQEFKVGDSPFVLTDVGGQRNERRKWLLKLNGKAGIMFLFGASEFDQVLYEDEKRNALQESLELFGEVCKSQPFSENKEEDGHELNMKNVKIILIFNKMDIFRDKIKKNSFRSLMKEYPAERDEHTEKEIIEFLKNMFFSKIGAKPNRKYYFKAISAVNRQDIEELFQWLNGVFDHSVAPDLAPN